jgi:hypothetical protein
MKSTPTVDAPTEILKVGEQKTLTPTWENPEGKEVDLGQSDPMGNEVRWSVTPKGIVNLEPSLATGENPGGTTAEITAVGLGSCTIVATATSGLVSAEIHVNVVSEGPTSGEIKVSDA